MKGFNKNQARVIHTYSTVIKINRPQYHERTRGWCNYRIFYRNFNRQEIKRTFHPIREKKKFKGKAPLQQWTMNETRSRTLLEQSLCLHAVEHDHARAAKQNTVQWTRKCWDQKPALSGFPAWISLLMKILRFALQCAFVLARSWGQFFWYNRKCPL